MLTDYYPESLHGVRSMTWINIREHIIRENISTWNHIGELLLNPKSHGGATTTIPYQEIGDIGSLLLNPSYCLLIFPTMTLNSHVVEHLHHNLILDKIPKLSRCKDHTPLSLLKPLAKWRGTIPTSIACGYDDNLGILYKDQDRARY